MFVVRITNPPGEDWKAFQERPDAFERFVLARRKIIEDELYEARVVMFHIPGETDARRAVERIKSADPEVIIVEKSWSELSREESAEILALFGGDAKEA